MSDNKWFGGGNNYKKSEYLDLAKGPITCAILPAFGSLEQSNRWSMHYAVHFGYRNSEGRMKIFQSPLVQNRQTKVIEKPDAALDRITALKAQLEQAKKDGNKELESRLENLVGMKGQFNLDKNHYINVITTDGRICLLKLRHRAKLALDETMKAMIAAGKNPGTRYFTFRRSGSGLDTSFTVSVHTETINIAGVGDVQKEVEFKFDTITAARMDSEAKELSGLYPAPTSDQVARIVKEGVLAIDEIFALKGNTVTIPATKAASPAAAPVVEEEPAFDDSYAEPVLTPKASSVASAPVVKEAKTAVAKAAAVAPPLAPSAMSDDDFLNSINV